MREGGRREEVERGMEERENGEREKREWTLLSDSYNFV